VAADAIDALIRYPDGREIVVQLFEEPVEGQPLDAVGIDDEVLPEKITPVADNPDYVYVIDVT
jgi:hypothetical protein